MEAGGRCHICGELATRDNPLEVDHLLSWADHGRTTTANIRPAHRRCNRRKGRHSYAVATA
jgi:5-methylcytosine-specific restriction endonuclease McrA